jgi:titin
MASWLPRFQETARRPIGKKPARFQPRLEALEDRQLPSTFTVNTVADSGPGSLRQAILDANNSPGLDTVQFSIGTGVQRIYLNSALPEVTDPIVLDATTQPGYGGAPLILLNGSNAGPNADGFLISAGNSVVKGFIIRSFGANGIELTGNGGDVVSGNYLGTDYAGLIAHGNGQRGLYINGSSGNTIGGTTPGSGNVISGNELSGLVIDNNSTQNTVEGNLIGTSSVGTQALGNAAAGVRIADQSTNNVIGGTTAAARNIISGNGANGVVLDTGTSGNVVEGNYIGTGIRGLGRVGNGLRGVYVDGASGNTVGGTTAGAGNLISGNGLSGVVLDDSATQNIVAGNLIGTNANGTAPLGNAASGVRIGNQSSGNTIGGTTAAARNVIAGNGAHGVVLDSGASNNQVQGNYIGTGIHGLGIVANEQRGIYIDGSSGNTIGGTAAGAGNVISGNGLSGVVIDNGSSQNTIQGNYIGTNAAGTGSLGNTLTGVRITGQSANNVVGGATASARNVISGNGASGISLDTGASANQVEGNYIGTDAGGAQPLGNGVDGVTIDSGATNNTIGVSSGNVIAYNAGAGVRDKGPTTTGNAIQANSIFNNRGAGIVNEDGGNGALAAPVVTGVTLGSTTQVNGTVAEQANTAYTVDFYANPGPSSSSGFQGQIFLGSAAVQTNGSGLADFAATLNAATTSGEMITATLTDASGNTSAFSQAVG